MHGAARERMFALGFARRVRAAMARTDTEAPRAMVRRTRESGGTSPTNALALTQTSDKTRGFYLVSRIWLTKTP